MADQSSATQLVGAYLASKGLPMTGENIRRALEQNASNPGLIKGLVNQAPPPPDAQGGAAPTSNQRGSAPDSLAARMHQAEPQQQPQAMSDASHPMPQAQPDQGGGMLSSLAQMILGGGAGAGLAHLLMGGGGGAPPMGQLGIPIPTGGGPSPALGNGPAALPAPQAQLPPPASVGGPAQVGGPAPMPQIAPDNLASGVNPIGPPQPGRMQPGPSSPVPPPPMPQGAAPASNIATGAPVSIAPRQAGADAADLGGHMDWGKILGDVGRVVGHR